MTKKFRKTALVEAVQTYLDNKETGELGFWTDASGNVPGWITEALLKGTIFLHAPNRDGGKVKEMYIKTLEGNMRVTAGDWIARGVKGELWPIKEDVFAESYEEVK